MRVVFDSQIFCAQQFGGISRYFSSMAREMLKVDGMNPIILAPLHINGYLENLPKQLVAGHRLRGGNGSKLFARGVSIALGGPLQALRRPDIAHRTYYYPLPRLSRSARNVLTVYDMIHERYPGDFAPGDPILAWKRSAVAAADHVICISENTRRDLLEIHGVTPDKVSVTHLGYDDLSHQLAQEPADRLTAQRPKTDRPYILYVGSRGGYKNFAGLLAAYAGSPWLRANFGLLCFGGGAFSENECSMISRNSLAASVKQTSGDDAALATCYRNASLFVYPSLYEGFGIPPLEAMSLDCPVACSDTSSLPEVVGDAAVTFDPHDVDAIRAALESVLHCPTARDALVARGRLRRERFSWQRCAQETVSIYQRIARA